jgi:biopolymer transport protein ExbD
MKYFSLLVLFIIVSCGNKEAVLLPKSNTTVVKNVEDHSPIYIFFRTKEKDTLAEVNRKNEIISTNWIFNIDKRLPLRLVIPEVMKLQNKKREEKAHKNEKAQNYYSYADTIGKNLAFIPFTRVFYKLEKPKSGIIVFFTKNNEVLVNNVAMKKDELQEYLNKLPSNKLGQHVFCFDKNLSFGSYIQDKIFIESLKLPKSKLELVVFNKEFVY